MVKKKKKGHKKDTETAPGKEPVDEEMDRKKAGLSEAAPRRKSDEPQEKPDEPGRKPSEPDDSSSSRKPSSTDSRKSSDMDKKSTKDEPKEPGGFKCK